MGDYNKNEDGNGGKFSVADMVVDRILESIETSGKLPWQFPYQMLPAYNYMTGKAYKGVNNVLLEAGEYITKAQINKYNKENGTEYIFQKGIKWLPVLYYSNTEGEVGVGVYEEANDMLPGTLNLGKYREGDLVGFYKGMSCFKQGAGKKLKTVRFVMKYTLVCNITYLADEDGKKLPSKIASNPRFPVNLDSSEADPNNAGLQYIAREGITLIDTVGCVPSYTPATDTVELNSRVKDMASWYSILYHELAHSTGHIKRLARFDEVGRDMDRNKEECIAEICASILCAETGISEYDGNDELFKNSVAYIQGWSNYLRNNKKQFLSACTEAEKASNYILGLDK